MYRKIIWSCVLLLLLANLYLWQRVGLAAATTQAIYFLNVGQGDAALLTSGDQQILIDGGPDNSVIAELSKVMPAWDRTIDLVVLTHPHADHLTGLFAVLERYQVGEVLATFVEYDSSLNRDWLRQVRESGAKLNYADPSDDYYFGALYIDTLLPINPSLQSIDVNNDSIVLRVNGKKSSVLLMGDAGFEVEDSLLGRYPGISADILKVGHHGSRYSSSLNFLARVAPKLAIISVGKNSYGHPAESTLEHLNQIGAKIYRTDQNGTIKFEL